MTEDTKEALCHYMVPVQLPDGPGMGHACRVHNLRDIGEMASTDDEMASSPRTVTCGLCCKWLYDSGIITENDEAIKFLGEIAAAMVTVQHRSTKDGLQNTMYTLVHSILKMLDSDKPNESSFSFDLPSALKSETPLHKLWEHFLR